MPPERRVRLERLERLERLARLGRLARLERLEQRGRRVRLERLVRLEAGDPLEHLGRRAQREPLGRRVRRARLDPRDPLESLTIARLLGHCVLATGGVSKMKAVLLCSATAASPAMMSALQCTLDSGTSRQD